jgi:prephenate dehydrogenase
MKLEQITIVGTGLIGASFALAIRKHGFRGRIVGCDREPALERAQERAAIDAAHSDPVEASRGSQVVVLATPVGAIIDLIERLGPVLPPDVLLTDVGSTKAEIVARARAVFGSAAGERFLGGHPMAGKEHSGVEHADADLFRDAAWLLTPASGQNLLAGACGAYIALLETMGARVMTFDPEQHDRVCAWVSHLPQMVATALASSLLDELASEAQSQAGENVGSHSTHVDAVGGRALREMTRIASSPYSMWRDIALTNSANIEAALHSLEQRLAHIRESLRGPALKEEFERGNQFRKKLAGSQ